MKVKPQGKTIDIRQGESILSALERAGIQIMSLCSGSGICGKCKIKIESGGNLLNQISEAEIQLLGEDLVKEGYRLACRAKLQAEKSETLEITIPPETKYTRQVLLIEGVRVEVPANPETRKIILKVEKPPLREVKPDYENLLETIARTTGMENLSYTYNFLRKLPRSLRERDGVVTVTLFKDLLIDIEPGRSPELYGLAVDIGTTKIAGYIIDLEAGEEIVSTGIMNPQIPFGEDLMSRLTYILRNDNGMQKLRSVLIAGLNKMIRELCETAEVKQEEIYEAEIVGNTAMHHIFFGLWPGYLAYSPYPPVIGRTLTVPARTIGLRINDGGIVSSLPIIGGFVGADAVADVLASGMLEEKGNILLVDIGTNTEIVLKRKEKVLTCSAASGPAFEGATIECGMRAAPGAIERVKIDDSTFEPELTVIMGEKPVGLTGSGLFDLVAELLRVGLILKNGRFNPHIDCKRLRKNSKGYMEYVLASEEESATGRPVVFTQKDIRQFQLGKAAIYTGIKILMDRLNLKPEDIDKLYIAGSFGFHIDPQSALTVGMFPEIEIERIFQLGNAAGSGAKMALLSSEIKKFAETIPQRIKYIELAAEQSFRREFVMAMHFPHYHPERFPKISKILKR